MIFVSWIIAFGLIVGVIAYSKGKDPVPWFLYGALLFIVALPHILISSPNQKEIEKRKIAKGEKKRCPYCAELINPDATICKFCGKELPTESPQRQEDPQPNAEATTINEEQQTSRSTLTLPSFFETLPWHEKDTWEKLVQNGDDLIQVSVLDSQCPYCSAWEGKILSLTGETRGYPTVLEAVMDGLFHEGCQHVTKVYSPPVKSPSVEAEQESRAHKNSHNKRRKNKEKSIYVKVGIIAAALFLLAIVLFPDLGKTVTYEEFSKIQTGMSYQKVVKIIGDRGEELSRSETEEIPGIMDSIETVMYQWMNEDGTGMNAIFQNNRLFQKAQLGL